MLFNLSGGLVLDIYTLVLALMLLLFQENDKRSKSNIVFLKLVSILAFLVGVSAIGDIADLLGSNFVFLKKLSVLISFAFEPFGFLVSLSYIDSYTIYGEKRKKKIYLWVIRAFAIINMVLVFGSRILNNHLFYYFDEFGYHRGDFYFCRGAVNVILCLSVMIYVVVFRDGIIFNYSLPIMIFPLFMALGGLLHITCIDLNLEYAGTVIACFILLIYVQKKDVNMDYLTGVANRRGIDLALKRAILESKEKEFAAIMIDVDYFKTINDKFGHKAGDEVLECIADVLANSFEKDDVVGRFGGDEFCIITQINDEKELGRKICNIKDSVASIDWSNKGEIDLSISTGVAVYEHESGMKVKDFLEFIDRRMYMEKMEHHLVERRHSAV